MRVLYSTAPRRFVLTLVVVGAFAAAGLLGRAALLNGAPPTTPGLATARGRVAAHASNPSVPAVLQSLESAPVHGTIVASARSATVALYHEPHGVPYRHLGSLKGSYGTRLAFLVLGRRSGWALVQLPIRPNKSSAWIKASQLRFAATDYHLSVELRRHRLIAWSGSQVLLRARIGVGRAVSPTPSGRYYLVYLLRPSNPDGIFGAYAFGLSAYSSVYSTFAGGDGEVGLHGTNEPAGLGHDVSHGCIRVADSVITRLAHIVPLGTPITITH